LRGQAGGKHKGEEEDGGWNESALHIAI
jgi:hypothetical protein